MAEEAHDSRSFVDADTVLYVTVRQLNTLPDSIRVLIGAAYPPGPRCQRRLFAGL